MNHFNYGANQPTGEKNLLFHKKSKSMALVKMYEAADFFFIMS